MKYGAQPSPAERNGSHVSGCNNVSAPRSAWRKQSSTRWRVQPVLNGRGEQVYRIEIARKYTEKNTESFSSNAIVYLR